MKNTIKIYAEDPTLLPFYSSEDASGFDLKSKENVILNPNSTEIVKTGCFVELPKGTELQIRSRSGLAAKFSIHVLNSPGTVDNDYRGELMVILRNSGNEVYQIQRLDRIAQAVLAPVLKANLEFVNSKEDFSSTERSEGGLGSTGK